MNELTQFQNECESRLKSSLSDVGRKLTKRRINGDTETFVTASVAGAGLEIYIYEDEAGIQGTGTDLRFEAPDYLTSNDLIDDFITAAVNLAK